MKAVVHEAGSVGERSSCLSGEWLWVVAWGSLLALAVGAPQGPGRLIVTDFVPFALPDVGDREIDAVVEAMRSGWLTTGPNAAAFEREFVDDLIGLVIGPLFVVAEAVFALGLRPELHAAITERAGPVRGGTRRAH